MSKLKNYIVQIRGVSYKPTDSSEQKNDGYIPLLRANNIKNGKINYDNLIYVKEEKVKENQFLRKGDILICTSNGSKELVGKAGIIKEDIKASFGAFCRVIRVKESLNYQYLIHFFHSNYYKEIIKKKSSGANINNLKNEDIDSLNINVIKNREQLEIAKELDKIVDIINIKEEQKSNYDELIKTQFVKMFGNIKNNDFDIVPIKNLVDINIEKVKKKFSKYDIIKYIDISSIDSLKNEVIRYKEYTIGSEPSRAQQCLAQGDILVSTVRPNLKNIAINNYNYNNLVGSSGFCVLRPDKCEAEYLLEVLKSEKFTNDMVALTTGASYPAVRSTDILNYEIAVPPTELQKKFAKLVKQIIQQKAICNKTINELYELLESKMQEYFGGVENE